MTSIRSKIVSGALAALALGGAALVSAAPAQAWDGDGYGWGGGYGHARPYYGGPVYPRPVHGGGYYGRPAYGGGYGECRVIIKERVTPWGEIRQRRIRICD
jgi:hypothetical protein